MFNTYSSSHAVLVHSLPSSWVPPHLKLVVVRLWVQIALCDFVIIFVLSVVLQHSLVFPYSSWLKFHFYVLSRQSKLASWRLCTWTSMWVVILKISPERMFWRVQKLSNVLLLTLTLKKQPLRASIVYNIHKTVSATLTFGWQCSSIVATRLDLISKALRVLISTPDLNFDLRLCQRPCWWGENYRLLCWEKRRCLNLLGR